MFFRYKNGNIFGDEGAPGWVVVNNHLADGGGMDGKKGLDLMFKIVTVISKTVRGVGVVSKETSVGFGYEWKKSFDVVGVFGGIVNVRNNLNLIRKI